MGPRYWPEPQHPAKRLQPGRGQFAIGDRLIQCTFRSTRLMAAAPRAILR